MCVGCKKHKKYLPETHPHLIEEWDYPKNGSLCPEDVSYGSHKKVWWIHGKDKPCGGYSWRAYVYNRTSNNNGCPACAGSAVTKYNNLLIDFPYLGEQWDYGRNVFGPEKVLYGSEKIVHWICSTCWHEWTASINNRTNKVHKRGCPACANQVVTSCNNFAVNHPHLLKQWDYVRNAVRPTEVVPGTSRIVHWECDIEECGFRWKTAVANRTGENPTGCPACSNRIVTGSNNLAVKCADLLKDWYYDKNVIMPKEVVPGSGKRVWWECSTCKYIWETTVYNRAVNGRMCPKCTNGTVSRISQRWLDGLSVEIREHYIKDLRLTADGFDPETNTVYEFLGDYWHGNPERFKPEDFNKIVKKTFGQLYQETMERIEILKENGYKVVYIWESDFLNI